MNVSIIGSGHMGAALGSLWAKSGHSITYAFSRDPNKLVKLAGNTGHGARAAHSLEEAVETSDVVFLGVWPTELPAVFENTSLWTGKVIISCSSGLRPDFSGKTVGIPSDLTQSVAETIAGFAPGSHVVEAFNLTFAETLQTDDRVFRGQKPTLFFCGDSAHAKGVAQTLIEDAGYDGLDAGGLTSARALETLATAWVQFAAVSGHFPNIAFKALRK